MYCPTCKRNIKSIKNWWRHINSKNHIKIFNKDFVKNTKNCYLISTKTDYIINHQVYISDDIAELLKPIGIDCENMIKGYINGLNDFEDHKIKFKGILNDINTMKYFFTGDVMFVYDYCHLLQYSEHIKYNIFEYKTKGIEILYNTNTLILINDNISIEDFLILLYD